MPRASVQRIDWGKQENTERLLAAVLAAQGLKVSFAPLSDVFVVVVGIFKNLVWIIYQVAEKCVSLVSLLFSFATPDSFAHPKTKH